ncbi:hypothetical protein IFT84_10255 [Rhizobium sp. CFBP 8762]|uniref:VpaChn25_0724 family phage protein n=1 Tax=Rhizobium sp. CFBP 8762 TaxID=2775279 RepID=UPI001781723D|nr:hypothetical protein [Rhizobium sp. CFBP 8762]MBD8554905.1 hypothetical protein [Rhizobium sp. CFBP 8762]
MSIDTIVKEESRLIILKVLNDEPGRTVTSEAIRRFLLTDFLIDKPRAWVEQEFSYLKDMGAIEVVAAGTVKIAKLTEHGARHLRGNIIIPGVQAATLSGA